MQYSRLADLGTGLVAYPIEGIGSALLIIAAAVSNYFDRNASLAVSLPLYLAVALSIIGLLLTAKAAPIMLGLAEPRQSAGCRHSATILSRTSLSCLGSLPARSWPMDAGVRIGFLVVALA